MRATDLDLGGLLELDPKGGMVRFAGRRALIMDAEARAVRARPGSVHRRHRRPPRAVRGRLGGDAVPRRGRRGAREQQVKLLRALQEKEIRSVGENQHRKVDVRVISATNRDLAREVGGRSFRKDLYYRLKAVELRVPSLRERREDLLPLARVLLDEAAGRLGRKITGLSASAGDQVLRHDSPGNVRELENAMERAAVLAEGERVELEDLPEEVRLAMPVPGATGPIRPLEQVEREYVLAALAANGANQARTAAQLGIGSATLYRKLRAWKAGGRARRRVA